MIKFVAHAKDGGPGVIVGLGITAGNMQRLREHKPIHVDLRELGIEQAIEILIFYGETEGELAEALQPFIGPDTPIKPFEEH